MTSRHSTYKSKSRWAQASEVAKLSSTFQRKLNYYKNNINRMALNIRVKKEILRLHGEVFKKLVDDGIVSKHYLAPYLPRHKDLKKQMIMAEIFEKSSKQREKYENETNNRPTD